MQVSKSYPKFSWLRPLGPITVVTIAILAVVIGKLDTKLDTEGNELIKTVQYVPKGSLLHLKVPLTGLLNFLAS
jgi:hypothetical protein